MFTFVLGQAKPLFGPGKAYFVQCCGDLLADYPVLTL